MVDLLDSSVVPTSTLDAVIQSAIKEHGGLTDCTQILSFRYCNGGNLRKFIQDYLDNSLERVNLQKVVFVTSVLGLHYIHKSNFIHSDIKPQHIYIRILSQDPDSLAIKPDEIEAVIGGYGCMQQLPSGQRSVMAVGYTPFLHIFSFILHVFIYSLHI